jgi:hypothetical protein
MARVGNREKWSSVMWRSSGGPPPEEGFARAPKASGPWDDRSVWREGQDNACRGSAASATQLEATTVERGDLFDDCEPEPETCSLAAPRAVAAQAQSSVCDLDRDRVAYRIRPDADRTP